METELEQERVTAVAERYRQRGYQVIQEPDAEQLPDFLQGFRPDLLAQNAAESVVVEIQSYGQVARSPALEKLAESVEKSPGWRLELVLSNPPESPLAEPGSPTFDLTVITGMIESSKYLAAGGNLQASVVLVWSALEAAIRTSLEKLPASFINNSAAALIKQAVAYGLIDPEDYETLIRLLPARNAAAHGFAGQVNPNLLEKVVHITESILAEMNSSEQGD